MVNYQNGKIYKIEDANGEMCYIGSTTKDMLCKRMAEHRNSYDSWKVGKRGYFTVFDIFEKYGVETCRIILLELVPCETREQITTRESFYVRSMECVNKNIPARTHKECAFQYYLDNKEVIKAKSQTYRDTHKAIIAEKSSEVIDCLCGKNYTRPNKSRYMKSVKHLEYIANQSIDI